MRASAPVSSQLFGQLFGMKAFLLTASLAALAGLAGCESPPPPPPPTPTPVAEAAPPAPPPPVLLPRSVVELASLYENYINQAAAIDPSFTAGDKVQEALKTAEHYKTSQLQQGQTAYGAIVALQDPAFKATLRGFAKDAAQRADIAARIMADPNYAASFQGADSAAGLVIAAFSDQAHKLMRIGDRLHQAAYDVQRTQPWSKADVADRPGRLALAKALSDEDQKAIEVDTIRLLHNATGEQAMGMTATPTPPPYTPLVARALAVAAMAALGEGGDEYAPQLTALLADNVEGQCLHLAKLNLYQCLSVAKPNYEDVFCLGQHAVGETGQCVMKGAVAGYVMPSPDAQPPASANQPQPVATSKHRAKKKASTAG
jgi:hypothetical protein